MHITNRSYLTAGIAALGVGAIALSPIQPLPNQVSTGPDRAVTNLAVELASTIDPITPWVDTIKTSVDNITQLFNFYIEKPFPLIQTVAANQVTYFQEATSGNIGLIPGQIWNNVQTFFYSPWSPGDPAGQYVSDAPLTTPLGLSQQTVFKLLPTILGQATYDQYKSIIDFTATPYSGQLVGLIGPLFAPLVELTRSFTAVGQFFNEGDVIGAINELINIPANVTDGVLNGAGYLDLTGVVNAISPLPPEVKNIGLNLGGLVSPPVPIDSAPELAGGVLFDSVAAGISYKVSQFPRPDGTYINVDDPGLPVSWVGSAIGLGQFLGEQMVVTPPPAPVQAVAPAAAESPAVEAAPVAAAVAAPAAAQKAAEVEALKVEVPKVEAPKVDLPKVEVPKVELPKVDLPKIDLPKVELPKVDLPALRGRAAAGSANSGNDKATTASSRGTAKSASARGAN